MAGHGTDDDAHGQMGKVIGPRFASYSDIQPIPEMPEAVDLGPDVLHPWTTLVAKDGEWTLRRYENRPRRWYICHPVHGWRLARSLSDADAIDELHCYAVHGAPLI